MHYTISIVFALAVATVVIVSGWHLIDLILRHPKSEIKTEMAAALVGPIIWGTMLVVQSLQNLGVLN
jgi:hypothetical protein